MSYAAAHNAASHYVGRWADTTKQIKLEVYF